MTIYDLERWLNANRRQRMISFTTSEKEIHATLIGESGSVKSVSKTLSGALENAFEELRRKDSGMESARTPSLSKYVNVTLTGSLSTPAAPQLCNICGTNANTCFHGMLKAFNVNVP